VADQRLQVTKREIEVRADAVQCGDYLLGLGRVQAFTQYGKRVTLHSEGDDWKVSVHRLHRVVVLRGETP
jgi:hypothetical protein